MHRLFMTKTETSDEISTNLDSKSSTRSGSKSFEAKVTATRKTLLGKYKSAYFGELKDEDLEFAARFSQNPDVLALLLRSKSKSVREALAMNGQAAAYDTSLALLKDNTTSVKEAVLEHACLSVDDFQHLAESGTGGDHLQIFKTNIWWGNDLQLYKLARNPHLEDDLFREINIGVIVDYVLKKRGESSPGDHGKRRPSITRQVEYIQGRTRPRPPIKISEAQIPQLQQTETKILELNKPEKSPTKEKVSKKPSKTGPKTRVGVSSQKDRSLAAQDDLTKKEFEFLIFKSRDEKTRKLAIANPAMPYSLFDRVTKRFPTEAHTSVHFWVKYLEDPHFLGTPDLPTARKLILNPDVPENFIASTFNRYEAGEHGRVMSKWFTTLLAIANHPNTPLWILDKLIASHRIELTEAAWAHPKKSKLSNPSTRNVSLQFDDSKAWEDIKSQILGGCDLTNRLVSDPWTSSATIEKLLENGHLDALSHPNCPDAYLEQYARSKSIPERLRVLGNPTLTEHILDIFISGRSQLVKAAAVLHVRTNARQKQIAAMSEKDALSEIESSYGPPAYVIDDLLARLRWMRGEQSSPHEGYLQNYSQIIDDSSNLTIKQKLTKVLEASRDDKRNLVSNCVDRLVNTRTNAEHTLHDKRAWFWVNQMTPHLLYPAPSKIEKVLSDSNTDNTLSRNDLQEFLEAVALPKWGGDHTRGFFTNEILLRACKHKEPLTRLAVAMHPNSSEEILRHLSADGDSNVAAAASERLTDG